MGDPQVFLGKRLFLPEDTRPGTGCTCPHLHLHLIIFGSISIIYRTGLPLVSPATLEPMGLPTDFKLLPKVNLSLVLKQGACGINMLEM